MKLVFFSSVLNHHQLPICLEFYKILEKDFVFVATKEMSKERVDFGYEIHDNYPFLLKMDKSKKNWKLAYNLSQDSDILIAGVIPSEFVYDRMCSNKITFRYSERFYKNGSWRRFTPKGIRFAYYNYYRYRDKKLYLLCASGYASHDALLIKACNEKKFKWGYFPEMQMYAKGEIPKKRNEVVRILWAGRLISWKRTIDAIKMARLLKDDSCNFILEIIGAGDQEDYLRRIVEKNELADRVFFLGSMSPKDVRKKMEKSDIFLFTSNKEEGWGVVLNEAMNSHCAVIASEEIGSAPFLIKNNINGIVYRCGNIKELFFHTKRLIEDPELRKVLGKNAYETITKEWNPETAARRFVDFCTSLINNEKPKYYNSGPMSTACESIWS